MSTKVIVEIVAVVLATIGYVIGMVVLATDYADRPRPEGPGQPVPTYTPFTHVPSLALPDAGAP